MNRLFYFIWGLILLGACRSQETSVEVCLQDPCQDSLLYFYKQNDSLYIDTLVLKDGWAQKKWAVDSFMIVTWVGKGGAMTDLFMEKGQITRIEGASFDPSTWTLSGGKYNKEWNSFREKYKQLKKRSDTIVFHQEILHWIMKNSSSPVTLLLIKNYLPLEFWRSPLEQLTSPAKDLPLAKSLTVSAYSEDRIIVNDVLPTLKIDHSDKYLIQHHINQQMYVLFYFTASWWPQAREANRLLSQLYRQTYSGKKIAFVSLSLDNDRQKWHDMVKQDSMTFINTYDLPTEGLGSVLEFAVDDLPDIYIVAPTGRLLYEHVAAFEVDSILQKLNIP